MRVLRRIAVARWLAAALVWCVAVPALGANSKNKKEEAPRTCVASVAELTVVPLEGYVQRKKGKFVLDKKSECLATPDGFNLPAVLVELPTFTQSYSVNVRSLLRGTVLAPRIDVLDAQKAQRRSVGLQDVRRRGDSLELDVFVTQNDGDDRYLVLYPDPGALGQGESRSSMGMSTAYIGTGYWTSGTESKVQVNYVDEGTLVVTLKGPQWAKKD
jgi:hypothetical protein